ncbi:(S)-benzoin forming benzil reductase [Bacillus solimangrovi]|uniref:Short-chain dehydrogenase n=1 Tax=Bacillus solimangrovi TaxID=1305675 RepID=A0A1E5LF89_9BACI|nr:(S)-benzoin forming benzil reductase [Bacillus solimangrovi]OEH92733.1 hypothetical protein BFG57_01640 [Bacillus solimangrovi]
MNIYIITGGSRGLGAAFVSATLRDSNKVISIARTRNEELDKLQSKRVGKFIQCQFDISNIKELDALIDQILDDNDIIQASTITLINNAGILHPMKPAESCTAEEFQHILAVNTLAPMALTAAFLRKTAKFGGEKYILNISSGAGNTSYHGWAAYSTTKAALNRFTQSVAFEEEGKDNPAKIISLAPGVVDTDMQEEIRNSNEDNFKGIERFRKLKNYGHLSNPNDVAYKALQWLIDEQCENGGIYDIRNL